MQQTAPALPPRTREVQDIDRSFNGVFQAFSSDWSVVSVFVNDRIGEKLYVEKHARQVEILRELHRALSAPVHANLLKEIAWDLIKPLWLHMHSESPAVRQIISDLLTLVVEKGNEREVFMSLCALLVGREMDLVHDAGTVPESVADQALIEASERCLKRIETNRPTRFLSEYTQSILALLVTMSEWPREGSGSWLVRHITTSYETGAMAALHQVASRNPEELIKFNRLMLSFATHFATYTGVMGARPRFLCDEVIKRLCPERALKNPNEETHAMTPRDVTLLPLWKLMDIDTMALKEELNTLAKSGPPRKFRRKRIADEPVPNGMYQEWDYDEFEDDEDGKSVSSLGDDDDAPVAIDRQGAWIVLADLWCEADASQREIENLTLEELERDMSNSLFITASWSAKQANIFARDAFFSVCLMRIIHTTPEQIFAAEPSVDGTSPLHEILRDLAMTAACENQPRLRHTIMLCMQSLVDRASDPFCHDYFSEIFLCTSPDFDGLRAPYIRMVKDKIASGSPFWREPARLNDWTELVLQVSAKYAGPHHVMRRADWAPVVEQVQMANFLIFLMQSGYLARQEVARNFVHLIRSSEEFQRACEARNKPEKEEYPVAILELALDRIDALLTQS